MVAVVAFAAPALAATNPFMDVPQGHWAYDAVGLLASRGIVSGYPDGAFKGAQPATRYEMASVVARALVAIDADKASKQDLELLKKLVMEFKDELDALGVKVDKLDKRVAILEKNLGGWRLSGSFKFDANFSSDDNNWYNENGASTEFHKEWFNLTLQKQIDDKTSLYARLRMGQYVAGTGRGDISGADTRWDRIFVDTKLPYDIDFRVGRWLVDFESDNGLYWEYDANPLYGSYRVDGFQLRKAWNTFTGTAIIARNTGYDGKWSEFSGVGDYMSYVLDLNWKPNEKFVLGATGYWNIGDAGVPDEFDLDVNTYGIYAGFKFTPAIELKGIYYFQNLGDNMPVMDDSPKAWKAVLDVKQEALKFTSLWLQYEQVDNSFMGLNQQNNMDWGVVPSISDNRPVGADSTSTFWMIGATQQWNDKWSTFLKYAQADYDEDWLDDAKNYTIGVNYQYTPAIAFQLTYDHIDYGDTNPADYLNGDNHVVKFRTTVNF